MNVMRHASLPAVPIKPIHGPWRAGGYEAQNRHNRTRALMIMAGVFTEDDGGMRSMISAHLMDRYKTLVS
ncbi:hypothetical protein BSQ44_08870 [Aquibium oceanicum]|uniref:Uncharacterized protein n=1 Tax=Aquibium oceanicum TaxID=1670800 RepID=A0A1L3SPY8_9HYPH|nr:hypothetical protein [Aquibium oceanicum]APH71469.1 hypothetical protein BSQ44_08870 [Aquibium oceanicum]